MSAPMEMVANTILPPIESSRRGKTRDVKGRDTSGLSLGALTDAASVRAQRVTMASERLTSDRDRRAEDAQEHIDVFV